jgi:flagellar biosynthesis protein FliQ
MKKNVLVFGLISGVIISILMVIFTAINSSTLNYDLGMVLGYSSMILAFSFVFVGIKNYRDKYNDGVIKFGKAFQVGILIALISSTFYVLTWLVEYYFFIPDFMDHYAEHMLKTMRDSGASPADIEQTTAQMADYKEMYKNPVFVILLTYMEVLPVGLLFTIASALILKRKAAPAL